MATTIAMATPFFQKNLADLVKGIRSHKKNEKEYIQKCLNEIKDEFKSTDGRVKCIAVQKTTYLAMLGYDMEWAAFHVVEVMADSNFQNKRIGYLAATQCFTPNTDVLPLATNLFKKEMSSNNQYETGMALNCLSNVCTPDLARDLVSDVIALLGSSRAYIRKKSVLVMFKIFLQFPDALRPSFPRLKEKLEDSDPSVVAAAVNTICELARKNPGNYLAMAPTFFKLLTTIQNNWTLIKIVKLFGALTPLEPRLAKKLVDPLTNIINTTPAKSLLYECLNTVSAGMAKQTGVLKLSLDKLKMFVEDRDQNLRYLGLVGLHNVMVHNAKLVADMRETVVECLNGEDITIRYRALDLVVGMVSKKNIQSIVGKLCEQVNRHEGEYKHELITKIIETCSQNDYEFVSNFEWYLRVLMDLVQCEIKNVRHGKLLADQFMDVITRVKAIRDFGIRCMCTILASTNILLESLDIERSNMYEVLSAAAWLCGEFCDRVKDRKALMENLVQPSIKSLPPQTQMIFVQSALKLYTYSVSLIEPTLNKFESATKVAAFRDLIKPGLQPFLSSGDVEVQERATQAVKLIELHTDMYGLVDLAPQLRSLFEEELLPVGANAQRKVPVPPELDLESEICHYESSSEEEVEEESDDSQEAGQYGRGHHEEDWSYNQAATQWRGQNTYILKEDFAKKAALLLQKAEEEMPPMKRLTRSAFDDLGVKNFSDTKAYRRRFKRRGMGYDDEDSDDDHAEVLKVVDLPEGASLSDEEKERKKKGSKSRQGDPNSIDARLNVDLSGPLRMDEKLPEVQAYARQDPHADKNKESYLKMPGGSKDKERKKDKERSEEKHKKKEKHKDSKDKEKKKKKEKDHSEEPSRELKWHERSREAPKEEKHKKDKDHKEKKSKDHKEHKDHKEKKSKSSHEERSDVPPRSPASPHGPSATALTCCQDSHLHVWYEPDATAPIDSNNIEVALQFQNRSSSSVEVSACTFDQTINLKAQPTLRPALPVVIAANTCGTVVVPVTSKDITRSQALDGRLEYAKDGQRTATQLHAALPCSLWMKEVKLTSEQFQSMNSTLSGRSRTIRIPSGMDVRKALQTISRLLRVKLVEIVDSVAFLYGQSCQGHHVCVIVKALSESDLSVEVKCSDSTMCNSLLQEVQEEFKVGGGKAGEFDFLSL